MKVKSESEVAQSCPTLSDPMDCSLPGSSIHGILQARMLEWFAISFHPGHLPNPGIEPGSLTLGLLGGSDGKASACNAGDLGLIPVLGRSPGDQEMATHSSILAWRIQWTEEPAGYSP